MFLHLGTQMYGKIDQVPGLFHVATQFFHLNFVPLIPLGSYVVLDGVERKEDEPPGVSIVWSGKSVLFAWLRAGLMVAGPVLFTFAAIEALQCLGGQGDWSSVAERGFVATLLLILLPLSYRITRAGPLRALALARQASIEPEVVAKYFVDCNSLPSYEEPIV